MLKTRVLSAILLVAAALFLIITGGAVLLAAGTVIGGIAYRELLKACFSGGEDELPVIPEYAGFALIVFWHVLIWLDPEKPALLVFLAVSVIIYLAIYVFSFPKLRDRQIMSSFFCLLYGPFLLSFVSLTRNAPMGDVTVWLIFISSSICDVGGYAFGMLFGKHKLCPTLSPKKTVEGAVGGVLAAALGGLLYALWVSSRGIAGSEILYLFPIFCGVCSILSMIGDLAASAIKRDHIIKDYGTIIPGHGGVMDRFDSVLFTAPAVYVMTVIWLGGFR